MRYVYLIFGSYRQDRHLVMQGLVHAFEESFTTTTSLATDVQDLAHVKCLLGMYNEPDMQFVFESKYRIDLSELAERPGYEIVYIPLPNEDDTAVSL